METYRVGIWEGYNADIFFLLEEFEAANDDEANAYAAEHYDEYEWWVLNAAGRNINE